jgi:hypothetical protein
MLVDVEVPIVIVGFGNAADVVKCLTAIGKQRGCPRIGVFIENGGANAFYVLIEALSSCGGPCAGDTENADLDAPIFSRIRRLRLAGVEIPVFMVSQRRILAFRAGSIRGCGCFCPNAAGTASGFSTPTPGRRRTA